MSRDKTPRFALRAALPRFPLSLLLVSLLGCHVIPEDDARNAPSADAARADRAIDAPAAAPVLVPAPSPLARAYHRGGNVLWLVEQALGLALPALLLFCGWSARMRSLASAWSGGRFYPTLVLTYVFLSAVLFVFDLPLGAYAGFFREHAYGLSTQRAGKWLGDQLKGWAVGAVVAALTLWVPYLLLQASPTRWWLWTGLLSLPFLLLTLLIGPLWIAPLFNKFGPMKDREMEKAVLGVASRAGIEGARVFEVEKSVDTKKVNAYVTGVGQTKRVVLWDTLLARLSPRQALFVVGHEAGHYVLGHVWINVLLSSTLILVGLGGVHVTAGALIARFGNAFGFDKLADPASMPLFILLLSLMGLVVRPPLLALSRHFEREADRFGLELTRDNDAGATAFVRLQEENLAVPRPGLLYTIFRASHPALGDRVDFINGYHPWREGRPLVYGRHFQGVPPKDVPDSTPPR